MLYVNADNKASVIAAPGIPCQCRRRYSLSLPLRYSRKQPPTIFWLKEENAWQQAIYEWENEPDTKKSFYSKEQETSV